MVKAVCSFCGHRNRGEAQVCTRCGGSLADARREPFRLPWASWVPGIAVAVLIGIQIARLERANAAFLTGAEDNFELKKKEQARTLVELEKEFLVQEQQAEEKHQALLKDARLISGATAAERHAVEWKRRQAHDPALVSTVAERALLEIEKLGKDAALSPEIALKKVAEIVTPPGSRIEVTPSDGSFVVRVAFRLSAVRPDESGAGTDHNTTAELRRDVEEITARMIQQLFDSCGSRGIKRLSVSCNRALLIGKGEAQRLTMRSVYRASVDAARAAEVGNWRQASVGQVASFMKVEHDIISGLLITHDVKPGLKLDPNEPLEF